MAELAKIDLGDSLPSLTLQNEKGEDIDVASLAAEKGVVMFLVPKADTGESRARSPALLGSLIVRGASGMHDAGVRVPGRLPRLHRAQL